MWMMRKRIATARSEDGIVMVVVLGFLLVLGLMSAGLVITATGTTQGSRARSASDRALAAAQTGLEAAIYRLNTSDASTTNPCIPATAGASSGLPAAGTQLCGPYTSGQLFPGKTDDTRWTFWLTPVIGSTIYGSVVGDTCTGNPLTSVSGGALVSMRCVTVKGEALSPNGTVLGTRRIQARVAAYASLFQIPGIFGTECLAIGGTQASCSGGQGGGTTNVWGSIGSNGQVNAAITNWCCAYPPTTLTPGDVYLGPNAPTPAFQKALPPGNTVRTPQDISLPDMATLFSNPGAPLRSAATVAGAYTTNNPGGKDVGAYNDNATGIHIGPNCRTPPQYPGYGYLAGTRTLVLASKSGNQVCTVSLDDGLYDLCSIQLTDAKSQFVVTDTNAAAAEVKIFIDSYLRPGSGCPNTNDSSVDNNISNPQGDSFLANATTALAGQLYVYGNPSNPDSHLFAMTNGNDYRGLLMASHSFVSIKNGGLFKGGLAANKLSLQNGTSFEWDPVVNSFEGSKGRTYYRTHWTDCKRDPTAASDPTSGC
jgi:type II secretory pathway pseudopilin PulG